MHAANMMLEVKHWIQRTYPWWNRRKGRDHIWLMAHDEGACYAPSQIYMNSILLTHWGRMDLDHQSASGWAPDNYSAPLTWPARRPEPTRRATKTAEGAAGNAPREERRSEPRGARAQEGEEAEPSAKRGEEAEPKRQAPKR
eukprot:gene28400-31535_t